MNNMRKLLNIPGGFNSLQFVFLAAKLIREYSYRSALYEPGLATQGSQTNI
jgi:hypothetical protein